MKKLIGLILALAITFSLAATAFAAGPGANGAALAGTGTAAIGSGQGTQPVTGGQAQAGVQSAVTQAAQPKALDTAQFTGMAQEMARILNLERSKRNLPLFTWQAGHVNAAQVRAQELSTKFDIVRPDGKEWTTAAPKAAYELGAKSEAYPSLSHFFEVWMDSPVLYHQVVNKEYKSVAIGYFEKAGTKYCIVHFYKEAGTAIFSEGWNKIAGGYSYIKNGQALTGWQNVGTPAYYFNTATVDAYTGVASPYALTGWQTVDNKTFYFQKNGKAGTAGQLFVGWKKIDRRTFYFRKNGSAGKKGELFTGFQSIGGYKFYFKPDGKDGRCGELATGWETIKGNTYYFQLTGGNGKRGRMFTGTKTIDGKTYVFSSNGHLIG